jgi:hypothetical protein
MVRQFNYLKEVTKMSRFLKSMIALLAIAAFAAPAMATDFSVSGQARVEGYYNDLDSADDPSSWFEQRVRLDNRFQVSDEVLVRIRFDFEGTWGWTGQDTMRNMPHTGAQTDYAYIQLNKEMFSLTAGQAYFGSSNAILVDHIGTGLSLSLKTPVSVKLMYTKYDEGGATFKPYDSDIRTGGSKIDEDATDDEDFYGAEVAYKGDGFGVSGVYAVLDNKANDDNKSGFGVAANLKVANFSVLAELDLLDGDNGAGMDYTGTQFYLAADTNASEALNVGGFFWYVAGDENDTVITDITNWDSFNPIWGGYVGAGVVVGSPISGWGPNSFISNAGLIAAGLNATFKASDDLGFKAQGVYGVEEDDFAGGFDFLNMTVSTKYQVAKNTYVMVDAVYEDIDYDDGGDDNSMSLWSQLQVNF